MADMIMRSLYLGQREDSQLRQLAHDFDVTKSDLIRAAVTIKLREWLASDDRDILAEIEQARAALCTDPAGREG